MTDERRMDTFTEKDRQVLKDVRTQVQGINGTVARHDEELFGHNEHGTVGVISRLRTLEDLALQAKTAVRVVVGLLVIVGFTNILLLFR